MSCLWKLLGDSCTILYPVPDDSLRIGVPPKLFSTSDAPNDSVIKIDEKELLALGTRCAQLIFTARVRSTTGRYCFHRCLPVNICGGGGVSTPARSGRWGGYPPARSGWWIGVPPNQVWMVGGGYPGYPFWPGLDGGGVPPPNN